MLVDVAVPGSLARGGSKAVGTGNSLLRPLTIWERMEKERSVKSSSSNEAWRRVGVGREREWGREREEGEEREKE